MKKINLFLNFKELYFRLIYIFITFFFSFFISYIYKIELFYIIAKFFLLYEKKGFIYTNLLDPLIIYIKLSIIITLFISLPVCIYIYIYFFFKSVFTFYVKYISIYLLSFYLISISIFILCYFKLLPLIISFLLQFQLIDIFMPLKLTLNATIDKYYYFFFNFIFILSLIIISINIIFFFGYIELFSKKFIIQFKYKKILYWLFMVLFIIVAPPDFLIHLLFFPFVLFIVEILSYFLTFWYMVYIVHEQE